MLEMEQIIDLGNVLHSTPMNADERQNNCRKGGCSCHDQGLSKYTYSA